MKYSQETYEKAINALEALKPTVTENEKLTVDFIVAAIREKQERENPKPLTLDELREMAGEPVFIVTKHGSNWDIVNVSKEDGGPYPVYFQRYGRGLQENGYGKTWLAYRSEPQEMRDE